MTIHPEDLDAVQTAMCKLLPRHLTWCADHALQSMVDAARRAESELATHVTLLDDPNYIESRRGERVRSSRTEYITRLRQELAQYRDIIEFLRVLRDATVKYAASHPCANAGNFINSRE